MYKSITETIETFDFINSSPEDVKHFCDTVFKQLKNQGDRSWHHLSGPYCSMFLCHSLNTQNMETFKAMCECCLPYFNPIGRRSYDVIDTLYKKKDMRFVKEFVKQLQGCSEEKYNNFLLGAIDYPYNSLAKKLIVNTEQPLDMHKLLFASVKTNKTFALHLMKTHPSCIKENNDALDGSILHKKWEKIKKEYDVWDALRLKDVLKDAVALTKNSPSRVRKM